MYCDNQIIQGLSKAATATERGNLASRRILSIVVTSSQLHCLGRKSGFTKPRSTRGCWHCELSQVQNNQGVLNNIWNGNILSVSREADLPNGLLCQKRWANSSLANPKLSWSRETSWALAMDQAIARASPNKPPCFSFLGTCSDMLVPLHISPIPGLWEPDTAPLLMGVVTKCQSRLHWRDFRVTTNSPTCRRYIYTHMIVRGRSLSLKLNPRIWITMCNQP